MNKKGISDGFMLIIQLIAIGLIFILLMYKVNDLDIENIHRLSASKNLGLSFSIITFLPGSFSFGAFNPEHENMLTAKEFYVKLSIDRIAYFEDIPSEMELRLSPDAYNFFSNKRAKYSEYLKNYDEEVKQYQTLRIEKSNIIDISDSKNMKKLECKNNSKNYDMGTLNICDKNSTITVFCDEAGNEVCKSNDDYEQKENINCEDQSYTLKVEYRGFEPIFSLGNSKAYLAEGSVTEHYSEVEVLTSFLIKNNKDYKNNYTIIKELESENNFTGAVLLTFNSENLNEINIKIPYDYFKDNYDFGCEFHNDIVQLVSDEKTDLIESVNIIPNRLNTIVVELGDINNKDYMEKIFPKVMEKLMEYSK